MGLAQEVGQRKTQVEGRVAKVDHFVIEQHQAAFMNEHILRTVIAMHQRDAAGQRLAYEGIQKSRGGRRLLRGIPVIRLQAQRFEERAVAERFHQTLQRWLRARPSASSLAELQRQLDEFREHYNEHRPHRALDRTTPAAAYRATPKAIPATNGHVQNHYRLRYDRLDTKGKMSLRRAGRMHHLGVGTPHACKRVLAFADDRQITVADLTTGEVLSVHLIEPNKTYWRNQDKEPGRWPGSPT